ncbi:MAG: ABC transporter permease [Deltaproteobacteria bacterium]|nr:ABC transporter permease [Deltaproteobacteria bacterium]
MIRGAWIVFAKEVKDNLRDRRAVAMALALPIIAPLASSLTLVFGAREEMKAWKEPLVVSITGAEHAPDLVSFIAAQGIAKKAPLAVPEEAVRKGDEEVVLVIRAGFADAVRAGDPAPLEIIADKGRRKSERALRRLKSALDAYGATLGSVRLIARGVDPALLQPLAVEVNDLATKEARLAFLLTGLPMFLVLAAFLSGLYVAIDTTAGERERGSLEPLLLNPVPRAAFAIGKLAAVTLFAWLGLLCTVLGFLIMPHVMPDDLGDLPLRLDALTLARMWLLLLPLALLASAIQVLVGTLAKGFKEAQASLSYLSLVPMVPGMIVAFSAPEPTFWLMLVPCLSEQLVMNAWLKGMSVPAGLAATSLLATTTLALVLAFFTVRRFSSDRFL